jgi:PASTA domain
VFQVRGIPLLLVLLAGLALPGSALAAPPANDDLAAAEELTGRVDFVEATNAEATKQTSEPNHGGNTGGASIWYRWTVPAAGPATISTCGSDFNTLLAVYTGDVFPLPAAVAEDDDSCDPQSEVTFTATQGTTYRIAVDGFGGATGTVSLSVRLAPPNDDFANAQQMSGETGSVTGTTIGASIEDGEPDHAGVGWNSAWFAWTAPSSGWATVETCGSPFDTAVAVYTGAAVNALNFVAGNDDACGVGSRASFEASAGTVYRIAVAGYEGETGDFTLSWNRNPPPPLLVSDPRISGVARDGETLTTTDGAWSGAGPFTYTYAWGRCDRSFDECGYIDGATARTFTIRSADVGYYLWVRVTASNAVGSAEAFSGETALVTARAPSNVLLPDVDGEARLGTILVAEPGSWLGTAPISYAYQWQACDATVTNCSNLDGQTGQVMRVNSVDLGEVIRVVVTATNVAGSASAASVGTDVVRSAPPRPRCVVPNVRGKSVAQARRMLRARRCSLGRVTRAYSSSVRMGKIIRQNRRPSARLPRGTRVNVVVSRGRRR